MKNKLSVKNKLSPKPETRTPLTFRFAKRCFDRQMDIASVFTYAANIYFSPKQFSGNKQSSFLPFFQHQLKLASGLESQFPTLKKIDGKKKKRSIIHVPEKRNILFSISRGEIRKQVSIYSQMRFKLTETSLLSYFFLSRRLNGKFINGSNTN